MTQQPPTGTPGQPGRTDDAGRTNHPDRTTAAEADSPGRTTAGEADSLPDRVAITYGEADLSTVPAFAGGFINFGYWARLPDIADRPFTEADRVRSEQDLYRLVLGTFDRPQDRTALEVGCGRGLGCVLALQEFGLGKVIGLDAHPDQIARARRTHAALLSPPDGGNGTTSGNGPSTGPNAAPAPLDFIQGAAQRIPLPDAAIDCLYSVEAAQHFRDLSAFAREAARVLRPDGRLALTTFFARDHDAARALPELLPSYADGLDVPHVIDDVATALVTAGLRDVQVRAIGDAVWEPYDRYMAQQPELRDEWARRYLTAYKAGLLDYYVITATAPEPPAGETASETTAKTTDGTPSATPTAAASTAR
ncbi:class I SAM-dependent methyltransferase [Streptomyces halobius]|uniref:Class I SAM-dependent methyltransferase n=1 Tax=Streptomyces halobius TaxID=2879846 RepID=A0ABY4MEF3_9ACTN|nr:class I SAM-dependent methyltransferase [Streptomyces halobius]UQA96139.1 class I SAM-dependent methyltransferase [Streptomyces halobius]